MEPGGKHATIVKDEKVRRAKVSGQIVEVEVLDRAGATIQHEEARMVPRLDGRLGDKLWREVVVEIRGANPFRGSGTSGRTGGSRCGVI